MRVAILGAGDVGGTLGQALAAAGHTVTWGVRNPGKVTLEGGEAVPIGMAAELADVVIVAVPFGAIHDVLDAAGDLTGKIVVDATNPVSWDNGPVHAPPPAGSAAEHVAALTQARVVKAFNTFGAEHMNGAAVGGQAVDLLIAGDDKDAKSVISDLGESIGMRVVDAGPLRNAASLEHMAVVWIHLAMVEGLGRGIVFKVLDG